MNGIRFQKNCDPDVPDEALLWAVGNIPMMGSNPCIFVEPLARKISQHLTECAIVHAPSLARLANADGYIHISQLPRQKKKFQVPVRGDRTLLNNAAQWVPMDEPEPEPTVVQDPASLTNREREAQVERYRYLGYRIDEPLPEVSKAEVVDAGDVPPKVDPATLSVTQANALLRKLDDDVERARMLLSERNGKARNGILRRWQ